MAPGDPELLRTTLLWALVDLGLVAALVGWIRPSRFRALRAPLVASAALTWGTFAVGLYALLWERYYAYFLGTSMRWTGVLAFVLYPAYAWLLWWLATHLPGHPVVTFVLLGGLEAVPEHLVAIYGAGILDKVPQLQDVGVGPTLAFAFFEYVLYWSVVLLVAEALARVWRRLARSPTPGLRTG